MEPKNIKVNVYDVSDEMMSDRWLWDFGSIILYGNKSKPTMKPTQIEFFSSISEGIDVETIQNMQPDIQKEITVYMGDYVSYFPTERGNADHLVSPDNVAYYITETVSDDDTKYYVLSNVNSAERELFEFSEIESWTPVLSY